MLQVPPLTEVTAWFDLRILVHLWAHLPHYLEQKDIPSCRLAMETLVRALACLAA